MLSKGSFNAVTPTLDTTGSIIKVRRKTKTGISNEVWDARTFNLQSAMNGSDGIDS